MCSGVFFSVINLFSLANHIYIYLYVDRDKCVVDG